MKIVPNKISIILAVFLLPITSVFAAPGPPPPEIVPPPPPGTPIDMGIVYMLILSIVYGIYKLKQNINNKKASN